MNGPRLEIAPQDQPVIDYGPRTRDLNRYLNDYKSTRVENRPDVRLGYYPDENASRRRSFMGKIALFEPDLTLPTDGLGPWMGNLRHAMDDRGVLLVQTKMEVSVEGSLAGEVKHSIGERAVWLALHYDNLHGRLLHNDFNQDLIGVQLVDDDGGGSDKLQPPTPAKPAPVLNYPSQIDLAQTPAPHDETLAA